MKNGYVYILINPSLKGLLKVGQTKKDPEERAKEISQGTGVPTPYIVAFKEEFNDCELAERMIHIMLEEEGYRISKNREFFEAEISDIIKKIMIVKEHLSNDENIDNYDSQDIEFTENEDLFSDFEDIELEETIYSNPWDDVENIADTSYYGFGDELQDYEKAYEYYIKAYKLGSPTACEMLGNMNKLGEGIKENKSMALNFYKEAISRGNLSCWVNIGELYLPTNIDNAKKAYKKYLNEAPIDYKIYYNLLSPLSHSLRYYNLNINDFNEIFNMLKPYKDIILKSAYSQLERAKETYPNLVNSMYEDITMYENNL